MLKKTMGKTFVPGIVLLAITFLNLFVIVIIDFAIALDSGIPTNESIALARFLSGVVIPALQISLPFTAVAGLVLLLISLRHARAARAYNARFDLGAEYSALCPKCGNRVTCTIRGFRVDKEHPDGFRRCTGCGAFVDRKYFGEPILKVSSEAGKSSEDH